MHVRNTSMGPEHNIDVLVFPLDKIPPLVLRILDCFEASWAYPNATTGCLEDYCEHEVLVREVISAFVDQCKRLRPPANVQRLLSVVLDESPGADVDLDGVGTIQGETV